MIEIDDMNREKFQDLRIGHDRVPIVLSVVHAAPVSLKSIRRDSVPSIMFG